MSDYYTLRRGSIVDTIAALGFAAGLIAAMVMRWSILNVNFRTGNFAGAVFDFSKTMLGWGIVGGLMGLGTGVIAGGVWERAHMAMRRRRTAAANANTASSSRTAAARPAAVPPLEIAKPSGESRLTGLRFDEGGFPAEAFVVLAARVWPQGYDTMRTAAALERTQNIGAWDGARLVGAIRILTDGYFVAMVPEVLVDPAYRQRGIGRELMRRALERAPAGVLHIAATSDSVGFFQRLGCELAPMGFIMRARASRRSDRPA